MQSLPVFVINLSRDVERRHHMTKTLAAFDMKAEFITAVDGRALSASDRSAYDRVRALAIYGVEMMDTEIACYLSHHRLYQRMVREGLEVALIMEDDVRVAPTLPAIVDSLLTCGFADWLVVRLDSKRAEVREPRSAKFRGTRLVDLAGGAGLYRLRTHVLGTGAYMIRRQGAERMLAYGERIFMPIDQTLDRYWENGIWPYVVRPFPVLQQEEFGSSTGVRPADRRGAPPFRVRANRRLHRSLDGLRKRIFNVAQLN